MEYLHLNKSNVLVPNILLNLYNTCKNIIESILQSIDNSVDLSQFKETFDNILDKLTAKNISNRKEIIYLYVTKLEEFKESVSSMNHMELNTILNYFIEIIKFESETIDNIALENKLTIFGMKIIL